MSGSSVLTREERASKMTRSRTIGLLVEEEPGRRNRRTADALLLATAALVAGLAAVVARSAPGVDRDVGSAVVTVVGWAPAVWRIAILGVLGLSLVIVVDVLLERRWALFRDLFLAALAVVVIGSMLAPVGGASSLHVERHLLSPWDFPDVRLAAVAAVRVVAGPELVRPVRVLAFCFFALAGIGLIALGAALRRKRWAVRRSG